MSADFVTDLREQNDQLRGKIQELREVNARANEMIGDISNEYARFVRAALIITTPATIHHLMQTGGKLPMP